MPALRIGNTLRVATTSWWRNRRTFLVLGVAVMLPLITLTDLLLEVRPKQTVSLLALSLGVGTLTVIGEALCSGLAEHVIRAEGLGQRGVPLRRHLRSLPLGRLVAVALITGAAVVVGLVLLVLPGVVIYAWLSLATPIVSFERVGVMRAVRGSVALVRGNFWPVLGLTTATFVPLIVADELISAIQTAHTPLWIEVVAETAAEAVVVTLTAAVIVTIFRFLAEQIQPPQCGSATEHEQR